MSSIIRQSLVPGMAGGGGRGSLDGPNAAIMGIILLVNRDDSDKSEKCWLELARTLVPGSFLQRAAAGH